MKTLDASFLSSAGGVYACFTTRLGGKSSAPFDTANLAFHVGDRYDDVIANHDLLAQSVGYERSDLVHMRQIHSDRITVVDESHTFDTPPECDALITNRPGIPLMSMSADCTPILIYDPTSASIGAVHAGRAGALNAILPKTIMAMQSTFGACVENMKIVLGPSIGGCCYEINASIAAVVREKGYENALRYEGKSLFLDVNTILLTQLHSIGIRHDQIGSIGECTACRNDTYFSYRADDQHTGRIAGVIMLR